VVVVVVEGALPRFTYSIYTCIRVYNYAYGGIADAVYRDSIVYLVDILARICRISYLVFCIICKQIADVIVCVRTVEK